MDVLSKFAPKELFIEPSYHFANFIKEDLKQRELLNDSQTGSETFLVSANPSEFKTAAKMFYELPKIPEMINFATV